MRFSDLLFGLGIFGAGIVAGVFLCEAKIVTGSQIKLTTKSVVDKIGSVRKPDSKKGLQET